MFALALSFEFRKISIYILYNNNTIGVHVTVFDRFVQR